jgi:iron complex transport system substrate-binding protein
MRILSLHPGATELLFALGAGGLIVGRCDGCDYPESALKIPSIGHSDTMTVEQASILEPDLVIIDAGQGDLATKLAPLRVIELSCDTLAHALDAIKHLGTLVEKEVEAEVLVHDLEAVFERTRQKTAKYQRTRAYAECGALTTSRLMNDLLEIAGAQGFTGAVTIERLREFDPHMIFIAAPNGELDTQLIAARDGWDSLGAVHNDRVFVLDAAILTRPGPRLAQGAKELAKILHGVHVNGS